MLQLSNGLLHNCTAEVAHNCIPRLLSPHKQRASTMPFIENIKPEEVETVLQPLFPDLVTGFLRMSPHSRAVAEKILSDRRIRFELDATSNEFLYEAVAMRTTAGLERQRFYVGLKAVERTWAAIFGYTILFRWTADRFNAKLNGRAMPAPPAALPFAIQGLKWAFSKDHNDELLPWPTDLPSPASPYADVAVMDAANAAAVRAVGWILLHELGHFDRGHLDITQSSDAPNPHKEEFEADEWAAAITTNPMELDHCQANLCVIPMCLGVLAGINWRESKTHPAFSARMLRIYNNHIVPKTHGKASLFNTALFAAMTPPQALLFLYGISAAELEIANDLDDFLPWWEKKMCELGA
jgi:hypothetical protein